MGVSTNKPRIPTRILLVPVLNGRTRSRRETAGWLPVTSSKRSRLLLDGQDGNAFIGFVKLAGRAVMLGHLRPARVMKSHNFPPYGIKSRAARTATLGWRTIVQLLRI